MLVRLALGRRPPVALQPSAGALDSVSSKVFVFVFLMG